MDANILIYAHRKDSPFHDTAARCVRTLGQGSATWAIPWPCLHEFLAIVTHPRVFSPATLLSLVLDQIDAWLESPTLILLAESAVHWTVLRALLVSSRVTGPRVHDARIAALCSQHGVRELWSADRDFGRFPEFRVVNPLLAAREEYP